MANQVFPQGALKEADGTFDFLTSLVKVLALDASFAYDAAMATVTAVIAGSHEATDSGGTAYARLTLGSKALTIEDVTDAEGTSKAVVYDVADFTFTGLDDTVGFLCVFFEPAAGANDGNRVPWLLIDTTDKTLADGSLIVMVATPANGGLHYERLLIV